MPRIGAIFTPSFPPERLRSAALAAEAAGVPELWLWEDCFRESAFAAASAVLAWTETLKVGIGVSPMPLRNVALLAMEIATLERLFPGRVIPGVGHGVLDWMGQVGARAQSPLTLMREYVPAIRGLLAGEELNTDGRYVRLDGVKLDWPPAQAPAVIAAGEGPKTLRLTGEVADGTVVPSGWTPDRIRDAVALVQEGRDAAGRAGTHEFIVFVTAAFGAGTAERVSADHAAWRNAADPSLDVSGDPEDVVRAIQPFFDAGATSVILQPTGDEPDLEGFLGGVGAVAALSAARG
nr:LLM class flavin-dependent oxidoreductase [Microbacterium lemovicicum]